MLLKATLFLADFAHKHGHLTKDDGIVEDKADEDCEHIHDFEVGAGAHFVATECQDCHVEHDHVLVPLIHRLKVIEAFVADTLDINEVEWRNPLLLYGHNHIEDATDDVQSKKHDKDEFENLDHCFLVFLELKFFNNFSEARDSSDFQNLEQLQKSISDKWPGNGRHEVDKEHSLHVTNCNLLPVAHLFTFNAKVSGPELHHDVDQEEEVGKVSEHFVTHVVIEAGQHELEADGKRGNDGEHENHHVPNLLALVHVVDNWDTAFLCKTEQYLIRFKVVELTDDFGR